jgi:MFS family permease
MPMVDFLRTPLIALLVRNADFAAYSAGSAISLIGMWMQRIAIGWLTWQLTKSGMWLGIVAFADFIPVVLVGPLAGAAADRWDRLRIVKISQALSMLQATILFALTVSGNITIWLLVVLSAIQGILVAFNQPARLAIVPSLVGQDDLASAVAINSIVFNLARFIGPMFAGLAIVWSGPSAAFAGNAMSYVAFLLALARIQIPPTTDQHSKHRSFGTDIREGITYTAQHTGIAALLVLLTSIGIGGRPINELLPGFAVDVFHAGAGGLSIMASSIAGGAILGGLWLGNYVKPTELMRTVLCCSLGGALAAIAVAASGDLWIATPTLVVLGFCTSATGIAIQTLIQLSTERRMRGRVMGLYGVIFRGAPAIGALGAGIASDHFGLRWAVFFGALVVIAVWLWIYFNRERIATAFEHDGSTAHR